MDSFQFSQALCIVSYTYNNGYEIDRHGVSVRHIMQLSIGDFAKQYSNIEDML